MRKGIDMKKIISLILVFLMLFSITACGGRVEPDINGGNTNVGGDGNEEEKLPNDITGGWGDPEPEPEPEPEPKPNMFCVFLLNRAKWDEVAVYYWNMQTQTEKSEWPGDRLYLGEDGLYKAETAYACTHLIFNDNNNGAQSPDLTRPADAKIVYDNLDNRWITYSEAMRLLNSGDTPSTHEHIFVAGVCECGESDPNYVPDPEPTPHEHIFVEGMCACGEKDPDFVDPNPKPHEHVYISGRCECGEVDPDYNPYPDLRLFSVLSLTREATCPSSLRSPTPSLRRFRRIMRNIPPSAQSRLSTVWQTWLLQLPQPTV